MPQLAPQTSSRPKLIPKDWLVPIIVVILFALMPLYAGRATQNMFTLIFCMGVFAMSYDILLGYTGILSFGHAMFFGFGAYAVGIIIKATEPTLVYVVLAFICSLIISVLLSLLVGFLSLRVKDTYYAMITLAFAELFVIMADKARSITNGADGLTFPVPEIFYNRTLYFYIALAFMVISFVILWRFTNSPVGRVLVGIRDNEQRVQFLGYKTLNYKLISTVVAGAFASLAGGFYAIHMRFVSTSVLGALKTIDALMATIIGGVGTLYGGVIGMGVINLLGDYLAKLAKVSPLLERWPIIFGILYILIVIYAPAGILGAVYKFKMSRQKPKSVRVQQQG